MNDIVYTTKPDPKSLPGFYEPKQVPTLDKMPKRVPVPGVEMDAFMIENAFSAGDCRKLIDLMNTSDSFEDVGVQGMKDGKDDRVGSRRTSIWSPGLAEQMWTRLRPFLDPVRASEVLPTDWWQQLPKNFLGRGVVYDPCAISPLLRFMKYGKNGEHFCHYDQGFIYPEITYRSLKSVVIYLTTNENAATRFIRDGQEHLPVWDRNFDDWSRPAREDEVVGRSECVQGNVLVFNHRVCHDVEQYVGDGERVIIRGDVIYELF